MHRHIVFSSLTALLASATAGTPPVRWGFYGHEIGARAAAAGLPDAMPAFFRSSSERLAYLNGEPDRWRNRALTSSGITVPAGTSIA